MYLFLAIIFLSTSIIFILLSLFVLLLFKKNLFIRTKYFYLPSIFYSKRANSLSLPNHQNQSQQQHQHQLENQQDNQHVFNNPNNAGCTQPLLMQSEQPVIMSIIAPNVEILPSQANNNKNNNNNTPNKPPSHPHFFFNENNNNNININSHFLIDKDNDSEVNLPLLAADNNQQDFTSHPDYLCNEKNLFISAITKTQLRLT